MIEQLGETNAQSKNERSTRESAGDKHLERIECPPIRSSGDERQSMGTCRERRISTCMSRLSSVRSRAQFSFALDFAASGSEIYFVSARIFFAGLIGI